MINELEFLGSNLGKEKTITNILTFIVKKIIG